MPQELVRTHTEADRAPKRVLKRISSKRSLYNGTGRTTFVNTLCGKSVLQHKDTDDAADAHIEDGVKIKPITIGE